MKLSDIAPLQSGSLMSFDVFMNGYRETQKAGDDVNMLKTLSKERQWQHHFDFENELYRLRNTIIVTNFSTQKIVFVSSNASNMTGYQREELIGQTPEMLQGVKTDPAVRMRIRQAIQEAKPFEAELINYRKNGSLYTCHIKGQPIFNREKVLVNYIAFEKERS